MCLVHAPCWIPIVWRAMKCLKSQEHQKSISRALLMRESLGKAWGKCCLWETLWGQPVPPALPPLWYRKALSLSCHICKGSGSWLLLEANQNPNWANQNPNLSKSIFRNSPFDRLKRWSLWVRFFAKAMHSRLFGSCFSRQSMEIASHSERLHKTTVLSGFDSTYLWSNPQSTDVHRKVVNSGELCEQLWWTLRTYRFLHFLDFFHPLYVKMFRSCWEFGWSDSFASPDFPIHAGHHGNEYAPNVLIHVNVARQKGSLKKEKEAMN